MPDVIRKGKRELRLSNLDKLFWPDEGITKGDLLELLPRCRARARAAPEGPAVHDAPLPATARTARRSSRRTRRSTCRSGSRRFRALVSTRDRARTKKWVEFPLVNDELALLWMVNMGCIDMNTWYSRDRQARPARLRALRPRPDARGAVAADDRGGADPQGAARRARASSRSRRPAAARASTCSSRSTAARRTTTPARFAEIVAGAIARAHPKLATTEWSKARRRGVLIDANQNGEGKTIASVYSVRPKPGAPVSTPLTLGRGRRQARTRRSTRCRSCSSACASTATCTPAC